MILLQCPDIYSEIIQTDSVFSCVQKYKINAYFKRQAKKIYIFILCIFPLSFIKLKLKGIKVVGNFLFTCVLLFLAAVRPDHQDD